MEIGEPVFLARLPKPFSGAGKTRFGPVWGLNDDAKRKRHEVCAATDGDSLNIYSVSSACQHCLEAHTDCISRLSQVKLYSPRPFLPKQSSLLPPLL